MNSLTNVFQKLFITLEAEHQKLQELELRRIRLTEEMRVLHDMLKRQNQQLRIAADSREPTESTRGDKNRVNIAQKPQRMTAAVSRSSSRASTLRGRRGSATRSVSSAKPVNIANTVKNAGTAGILSKSGSKIPKTFSLNSPPSKTTTFTVGPSPSKPASVLRMKMPAGVKTARARSSIVMSGSKVTNFIPKSITQKASSKIQAVSGKPFTMVKSNKLTEATSKTSAIAVKPNVMPKPVLKILPKPGLKNVFNIKKSGKRNGLNVTYVL